MFKGTKKCLMVVRDSDDEKSTIGSAAVQCAVKKSKLVSFNNCSMLDAMTNDLNLFDGIKNENFWFGVFASGAANKRKGKRNFLEDGKDWLIDSYVHILKLIRGINKSYINNLTFALKIFFNLV